MKKALALLTLAVLVMAHTPTKAQSKKRLDEKYGFRDLKFESDTSAVPGLMVMGRSKRATLYKRPLDTLKIGGAPLKDVVYRFYLGKLSQVVIETLPNGWAPLLETLEAQYGRPSMPQGASGPYNWNTKRVKMSLDRSASFVGTLYIDSAPMRAIEEADNKAAAKAGKRDL